jgi:hypothetical protein
LDYVLWLQNLHPIALNLLFGDKIERQKSSLKKTMKMGGVLEVGIKNTF